MGEIFTRDRYANSQNRCTDADFGKAIDVDKWQTSDYDSVMNILKSE